MRAEGGILLWVAHASRVLVAVFQRNELSLDPRRGRKSTRQEKFATAERRRQHTRGVRYPEQCATLG